MGYAQLSKINYIIKERKKLYQKYIDELIKLNVDLTIQKIENKCNFVPWTFALKIGTNFRYSRDQVISRLLRKNIETRKLYYLSTNNSKGKYAGKVSNKGKIKLKD